MRYYVGYFGGGLILVLIGALVARYATGWVAGFRPRYKKTLISTFLAYLIINAVALPFLLLGGAGPSRGLQMLIGLAVLSCTHFYLLKSETGGRLTPAKSIVVAVCQLIGAIAGLMLVLLILLGVKKLFV